MSKSLCVAIGIVIVLGVATLSGVPVMASSAPATLVADGPAPPPTCWPPFIPCVSSTVGHGAELRANVQIQLAADVGVLNRRDYAVVEGRG